MKRIRYEQKALDIEFRDNRCGKKHLQCVPHLHRELELVCMLEGETVVGADSVRTTLYGGDVFLTFPDQIHFYESSGLERYYLYIVKPDLMPELMETFTMGVPDSPVIRGAAEVPHIRQLFDTLADICNAKGAELPAFANAMRRGYLLALFSELLSRMNFQRLPVSDSGALRSIISFCTQNYADNLSLSVLEERLHLNKYYISHLFSERLGLHFNDYINSLRISEACRYLLNTELSITEISERVGFNTLRTFNRAFVKQTGVSPSEYRKNDSITLRIYQ